MSRNLLRPDKSLHNYLQVVFGSALGRGIAFVNSIIIARVLGPDQFGIFAFFFAVLMLNWLMMSAFDTTYVRYAKTAENESGRRAFLTSSLALKTLLSALCLITAAAAGQILPPTPGPKEYVYPMILTGTSAGMFLGFLMTLATIFREREQFARFTLLTNMHTLVVFGITLVLLISMKGFSLGVIVSVYTGAAVLTGVVALVTILKREKPGMPTREEFRSFMSWGKWMFLISLSFFLFDRMDLFFITRYLSPSDVGIYAAGVQVVLILSATTGALNNVLVPKAVLSLKSRDSLRAYIRESAVPVLMIVAVILILMAASPMLIKGLYGERYAAAVPIAQVLCAGWLIMCVYLPFSYIFYAFERPSVRFYLEFGKLVMGVSLLYFMVPRYGIMGAALAVAVALSVNAVVSGVVLRAILRRSGFVLNGLDAAFLKEPM